MYDCGVPIDDVVEEDLVDGVPDIGDLQFFSWASQRQETILSWKVRVGWTLKQVLISRLR